MKERKLMHNPPHPGKVLRKLYIEPLNLTITQVARGLNITRKALYDLINEKSGISPQMAFKLGKAFNTSPEFWFDMQYKYDLWNAGQNVDVKNVQIMYG